MTTQEIIDHLVKENELKAAIKVQAEVIRRLELMTLTSALRQQITEIAFSTFPVFSFTQSPPIFTYDVSPWGPAIGPYYR